VLQALTKVVASKTASIEEALTEPVFHTQQCMSPGAIHCSIGSLIALLVAEISDLESDFEGCAGVPEERVSYAYFHRMQG
jgi:hypothetical protein